MNSLKFDGRSAWFVTPDNKYGLSTYAMKNITENDFSFLTEITVNWDKMNPNDLTREGGIIIKNGLHMGLSVVKPNEDHCYIKGTIWTSDIIPTTDTTNLWETYSTSNLKNFDILVKVNWEPGDELKKYKIGFSFKKNEKEFSIYCNGTWHSKKFEGSLIDYSNAWMWFGASNPLDSCPTDFRQFFNGEMFYAAICSKFLNREEIDEVYNNPDTISKRLKPAAAFNFQKQTPYKILDITHVGNNLIKFDKSWMDSI
jgi:hypothetical protein